MDLLFSFYGFGCRSRNEQFLFGGDLRWLNEIGGWNLRFDRLFGLGYVHMNAWDHSRFFNDALRLYNCGQTVRANFRSMLKEDSLFGRNKTIFGDIDRGKDSIRG